MKILLTNHHLRLLGGSETYTFALARALQKRNHSISVLTGETGPVSEKIVEEGIPVVTHPEDLQGDFDIIHCHHNGMAILARHFFPETPMIFVSHGIVPGLEEPPSIHLGIARFVGISQEVVENLKKNYEITDPVTIHNGVDCQRFSIKQPIKPRIEKILILSNRITQELLNPVLVAAQKIGAEVDLIGINTRSVWETEKEINSADLVITLGRGVLESMACGRAVYVYDIHGADGFITESSYSEIIKHNFSGRRYSRKPDEQQLVEDLADYSPAMGAVNRELALKNHNIDDVAASFEAIYQDAIKTPVEFPRGGVGGREILYYLDACRSRTHFLETSQALAKANTESQMQLQALQKKVEGLFTAYNQKKNK